MSHPTTSVFGAATHQAVSLQFVTRVMDGQLGYHVTILQGGCSNAPLQVYIPAAALAIFMENSAMNHFAKKLTLVTYDKATVIRLFNGKNSLFIFGVDPKRAPSGESFSDYVLSTVEKTDVEAKSLGIEPMVGEHQEIRYKVMLRLRDGLKEFYLSQLTMDTWALGAERVQGIASHTVFATVLDNGLILKFEQRELFVHNDAMSKAG